MKSLAFLTILAALALPAHGGEVDPKALPKDKISALGLYLTAKEAYDMKTANPDKVLFVDVRTQEEMQYVGFTPLIDANIPYVVNDNFGWDKERNQFAVKFNTSFGLAVTKKLEEKGLGKDAAVILMCRSGDRSSKAMDTMIKYGIKNAYSVVDGFEGDKAKDGPNKGKRVVNGWKNSGLPWTYEMDKKKMYFEE